MFLTYKKGLKLDGKNPTLLYGYGGFDISLTPSFSIPQSCGWRWVVFMHSPICGAAGNTGKSGIWPAPKLTSRMSSTTSLRRRSG